MCLGIDPSNEMLSCASAQSRNVAWRKGRAENLCIENDSIDVVFSVDVIHHVTDRVAYFSQAFQILKSGGKLCTVTDSDWIIRQRALSHYFPETIPIELQRYPAINDLRRWCMRLGSPR
jgi:ubiquinone/menaquinone biosynthesis C-methylase UbiE